MLILLKNTLTEAHRIIVFDHRAGHPVAQACRHIELTTTFLSYFGDEAIKAHEELINSTQAYAATEWWSWDSNPVSLAQEYMFLTITQITPLTIEPSFMCIVR